jgi:hypothetical protein
MSFLQRHLSLTIVSLAILAALVSAPLAFAQAAPETAPAATAHLKGSVQDQAPQLGAKVLPSIAGMAPSGSQHEGVKMHGHWIIDVKNADGTLAEHRDFENTITGFGQELLAGLLSGYIVPSDYAIFLTTSGTPPCTETQGFPGCGIVRSLTTLPASELCQFYPCFAGLTYSANLIDSGSGGSSFVLAGSFTANQAGTITEVETLYGTCAANVGAQTALATVTPATCSTTPGSGGYRQLSEAGITTVSVVATQIVQVTVTISFS